MARVIQEHHLVYGHPDHTSQKDIVAVIYKGEHAILTKIQWFTKNNLSKGFIKALKVFIALNEDRAEEL